MARSKPGKSIVTPRLAVAGLLLGGFPLVGCGDDSGSMDAGIDTDGDSMGTGSDTEPSSGTGTGTDSGTDTSDTGPSPDFEPAPGGMRKLMVREYVKSIEVMFGTEAAAAAVPPNDVPQDGFDAVGASILSLPADAVEDFEVSATAIADAVVANPGTLAQTVPCITGQQDDACYDEIATVVGRWAFRRDPTGEEIDRIAQIGLDGRAWGDGDFHAGLKYELMAILQSPSFLYIIEVGEMDETTGFRKLTKPELATRMSFFLLGRNPDLSLLDDADAGGLDTADQVRSRAEEMLAQPEAKLAVAAFFDEALRLRNLPDAPKNADIFPEFSPQLAGYMRQETQLLLHDIIWNRDTDYRELFSARYTFINDPLAELYGMQPPGMGSLFVEAQWPANQNRAGYMSQASFLTWQSGPLRNSPSKRGKYVQEMVLCNDIPPPDPDAELDLPDPKPGQTLKELLEQHMEAESCAACHAQFDPIGFAYEPYTAIGAFRTEDNGSPIDPSGEIPAIGAWANAQELGDIIAADPRTSVCLIENLIRGQLGHTPVNGEDDEIDALDLQFSDTGYSVQGLLVEFVASPLFQYVNEPK